MDWITGIQNAINYIEDHITEELDYATGEQSDALLATGRKSKYRLAPKAPLCKGSCQRS